MYKLFEEDTGNVYKCEDAAELLKTFRGMGWYIKDVDSEGDELDEYVEILFSKGFYLIYYDAFKRLSFWDNKDYTWREVEIRGFNMKAKLNDFLREQIGT